MRVHICVYACKYQKTTSGMPRVLSRILLKYGRPVVWSLPWMLDRLSIPKDRTVSTIPLELNYVAKFSLFSNDKLHFRVKLHPLCLWPVFVCSIRYNFSQIDMANTTLWLHILVLSQRLGLPFCHNLSIYALLISSSGRFPWTTCRILCFFEEPVLSVKWGVALKHGNNNVFSSFWQSS